MKELLDEHGFGMVIYDKRTAESALVVLIVTFVISGSKGQRGLHGFIPKMCLPNMQVTLQNGC